MNEVIQVSMVVQMIGRTDPMWDSVGFECGSGDSMLV
jgi:hypothetical protein